MIDEYIPSLKKETVTIEKKVYEVLQKNNLDLMQKVYKLNKLTDELSNHLENAKEALMFYAEDAMYEYYDKYNSTAVQHDGGQKAREALKEIER